MNSKQVKIKVDGKKHEFEAKSLPSPLLEEQDFLNLTDAQRAVVNAIHADPESVHVVTEINGETISIFATGDVSINIKTGGEHPQVSELPDNPVSISQEIKPFHRMLFVASSDITVNVVSGRNFFGWVKAKVNVVRCSTVVSMPAYSAPNTVNPLVVGEVNAVVLNEAHIVDSEITKGKVIEGTTIEASRLIGETHAANSILNDVNVQAKKIEFSSAWMNDLSINVKSFKATRPAYSGGRMIRLTEVDFRNDGVGDIVIDHPMQVLTIPMLEGEPLTLVRSSQPGKPIQFTVADVYGLDNKVRLITDEDDTLEAMTTALVTNMMERYPTMDTAYLGSLVNMISESIMSRISVLSLLDEVRISKGQPL